MMNGSNATRWLTAGAMLLGVMAVVAPSARAAETDVVMSELMYHALADDTGEDALYDYVEIHNRGADTIDLTGWSFSAGIELVFPDVTIAPGAYLVVARDSAAFSARYGFAPALQWTGGNLSNGGETVALSSSVGTVVDAVAFDDIAPWPGSPDGAGPSLERLDLALPNTGGSGDAANWLASSAAQGTPGEANSVLPLLGQPAIIALDDGSTRPLPDEPIQVTASVVRARTVTVEYRVMFGPALTLPMLDDDDSIGGAGDGNYTALLPPQPPRTLVRYRIVATGDLGETASPSATDTIDQHGLVTDDPSAPADVFAFDWFMSPADYTDMLTNHRYDDVKLPGVVAVGDQVVDNALFRVRGNTTRSARKPSLKVELPDGYLVEFAGQLDQPVDEFNLFRFADPVDDIGWEIADEMGLVAVDWFPMRIYNNGAFWSAGAYLSATDGVFRDSVGYGDAAVYKANGAMRAASTPAGVEDQWEKEEGADGDFTDIWALTQVVDAPKSDSQYDALLDELDVPAMINYWVYIGFAQQTDAGTHNFFMVRDPEGSGRWHADLWDMAIFHHQKKSVLWVNNMLLLQKMNAYPAFQRMYERRLKSVIDSYSAAGLIDRYQSKWDVSYDLLADDFAMWRGLSPGTRRFQFTQGVENRFDLFEANTDRPNGRSIPRSQSTDRPIRFARVADASESLPQLVELTNDSVTEAFDLTGWSIDGLDFTFPPGTVLLPGATVTISSDDALLRQATDGAFAAGEFDALPAGGLLELRDAAGTSVDTSPADPAADHDVDGVPNSVDNCPVVGNPGQEDGDGDGVGDACDPMPTDGPQGDLDGDGAANLTDNCRTRPNADQLDGDGDGVGDVCDPDPLDPGRSTVVGPSPSSPTVTVVAKPARLDVSWNPVTDATGFRLRWRVRSTSWSPWIMMGASRSLTIETLTNGSVYEVAVSARVAGVWSRPTLVTGSPFAPLE